MKQQLILVATALVVHAASAQVYRWTDAQGKVHYGDAIPEAYKKQAKQIVVRDDTPSAKQIEEAEGRLRKQQQTLSSSQSTSQPTTPSALTQATTPPVAASRPESCAERWKKYDEAYACFNPYRNGNGSVKPEAFQKCKEVRIPDTLRENRGHHLALMENLKAMSNSCICTSSSPSSYYKGNSVPSLTGLTFWSSRHLQAPLVGSLRAAHSGAAYRGR